MESTLHWRKGDERPENEGKYLVAGYEIKQGRKNFQIKIGFAREDASVFNVTTLRQIVVWSMDDFLVEFWSPLPEYPREV